MWCQMWSGAEMEGVYPSSCIQPIPNNISGKVLHWKKVLVPDPSLHISWKKYEVRWSLTDEMRAYCWEQRRNEQESEQGWNFVILFAGSMTTSSRIKGAMSGFHVGTVERLPGANIWEQVPSRLAENWASARRSLGASTRTWHKIHWP